MRTAVLADGTRVHCILRTEARVLDRHIAGYLKNGIEIRDGDTIFDVGANIGLFGIRAMQQTKSARVFAFEPVPVIYEVLKKNAELFGADRYRTFPFGIGSAPGKKTFTYYPNSPALSTAYPEIWNHTESLAHAVSGNAKNAPAAMWWARLVSKAAVPLIARRLRKGGRTLECSVRTISNVMNEFGVEKIHLLKIDCEGAEWEVLGGVSERDWPRVEQLVAEVHDSDGRLERVKALLQTHGFRNLIAEQDAAMEKTELINLYATR